MSTAANFNDDLVCYIESEKAQLTQILTTQETATQEIVFNIKNKYEHELSNARELYDEMAKKCAKLEIDVEDFKSKLGKKTKDLEIAERNGMIYETRCNDLQLQFNQSQAERKKEMRIIEKKDNALELACSVIDMANTERGNFLHELQHFHKQYALLVHTLHEKIRKSKNI